MKHLEKFFPVLQSCPLFAGIERSDLQTLLICMSGALKHFAKNSFVLMAGDAADSIGIVLSGSAHVLREDFWGRRSILTRIAPGGLFGEAFAYAGAEKLPVSVLSAEESQILLLASQKIFTPCSEACAFHVMLIKNLARLLAEKNVILTRKLEHVTQRSTRDKLLSYLSEQANFAGGNAFDIPFDRQELADFLSIDRSAMSAELSRIHDEGLLRYHKNHFELLR